MSLRQILTLEKGMCTWRRSNRQNVSTKKSDLVPVIYDLVHIAMANWSLDKSPFSSIFCRLKSLLWNNKPPLAYSCHLGQQGKQWKSRESNEYNKCALLVQIVYLTAIYLFIKSLYMYSFVFLHWATVDQVQFDCLLRRYCFNEIH